jgi:cytochrome P450
MHKLDSFLRESARTRSFPGRECCVFEQNITNAGSPEALSRVAMKPFVFSDGTFVPAGTLIIVPMFVPARDESQFPHADVFDPFRFEQPSDKDNARKQFTSSDLAYLGFGYGELISALCRVKLSGCNLHVGKHACPGRHFAGNVIKTMFVHLLLKYDMRTEIEGERPKDMILGPTMIPNTKAKVLFRRRPDCI